MKWVIEARTIAENQRNMALDILDEMLDAEVGDESKVIQILRHEKVRNLVEGCRRHEKPMSMEQILSHEYTTGSVMGVLKILGETLDTLKDEVHRNDLD